ncbi:MAG TPA: DUF892 family protein [Solirubrobacteraceae bacterium]|jgi:ferritin-like metal-binding protein YciE|nr:DUF892 family protein [Solirubrobacteraceae bacterium]
MADLKTRDAKLVQYLNEAYGKEKELETALEAHIAMTTRAPYRKRLRQHLSETKRHANEVQRRVKQLGGDPEVLQLPGPEVLSKGAGAAAGLGSRAVAAAKGPLHAIRGTGEQEKMLKNAKSEYSEEHEEIATYQAIEVLASSLGDKATAQLAKAIRREEERMASFLSRLIPTLTKAVIQEEVPAAERRSGSGGRKATKRAGAKRGASRRAGASAKAASAKRAGSASRAGSKRGAVKAPKARGGAGAKRSPSSKTAGARAGTTKRAASAKAKPSSARSGGAKRAAGAKAKVSSAGKRRTAASSARKGPAVKR